MEQKQIFGVILGVIVCIVMLFAGLYLTGQIGMKRMLFRQLRKYRLQKQLTLP